jgi:HlyD family secretion protein
MNDFFDRSTQMSPLRPAILPRPVEEPSPDLTAQPGAQRGRFAFARDALRGRRKWFLLVLLLLLVAAVAYATRGKLAGGVAATKDTPSLTVTTATVERAEMARTLLVTGSITAWDELPIGSEIGGYALTQVLVEEGDKVQAGQLLARFNDSVLKADLAQKEASLREAEAAAAQLIADARRAEELSKSGTTSGRDLDTRRAAAVTAQARVGVAKANLDQAAARLRQTEVRAPTAGTITSRSARLGWVPGAGTEMFRVIREDRLELWADVPETDLPAMAVGQKVRIRIDGAAESTRGFDGVVRLVGPAVNPQNRLGKVQIALPADTTLKPGMFVRGMVELGRASVLAVPEQTIVYKDQRPMVFALGADNKVQMRNVQTGARQNGKIALLKGVSEGEKIVMAGAGYLKEGDMVTPTEAPTGAVLPLPTQE